jgi:hypothetical protein
MGLPVGVGGNFTPVVPIVPYETVELELTRAVVVGHT